MSATTRRAAVRDQRSVLSAQYSVPGTFGRVRNTPRSALSHPRGYTFVEILIVITIIGILVALLLPAVQAAREAARRASCGKHLEQLIIAVHNYEMQHGVYPSGTINPTGPIRSIPQGYHHSWLVQLLPYLEEKNTFAHVDESVGVYDVRNMPVRQVALAVLDCPTQWGSGRGYSDYAAVHNDMEVPIDVDNNGVFFLNSDIRQADVIDGSSHTVFIGEKITVRSDLGWMSGTRATLRNMGMRLGAAGGGGWGRRRFDDAPLGHPPGLVVPGEPVEEMPPDDELLDWAFAGTTTFNVRSNKSRVGASESWEPYGGMAREVSPEEFEAGVRRVPFTAPTDGTLAVGGFGSPHPGGSQFAFGDGSVRFTSASVDPQVQLDLANRHDQELPQDWW